MFIAIAVAVRRDQIVHHELVLALVVLLLYRVQVQLGQTEVSQLNESLPVDKNIVRLKVSVNNPVLVKVVYCQYHLGEVESGSVFCQRVDAFEQVAEIASFHVFHDDVKVLVGLEGVHSSDDKIIVHFVEDISLVQNKLSDALFFHLRLVHDLDCEQVPRFFLPCKTNLTISSMTDRPEEEKVFYRRLVVVNFMNFLKLLFVIIYLESLFF
mmetsp:Transcript_39093/g.44725  ORF Transcript_39093/g.44725 Transcript_39093/m.44725 type:complete len:211 (-) Transcript_39093:664-1296(-)